MKSTLDWSQHRVPKKTIPITENSHNYQNNTCLPAQKACFNVGNIDIFHSPSTSNSAARGLAHDGTITFHGIPSPQLIAHEIIHVAQQSLAINNTAPLSSSDNLEREATHLSAELSRGEDVTVEQIAPQGIFLHGTDPDKTYISTLGIPGGLDSYLEYAYDYHQKWGYNPVKVSSIEQIVGDMVKDARRFSCIRIVSHATAEGLMMRFVSGSPLTMSEKDLRAANRDDAITATVFDSDDYSDDHAKAYFRAEVLKANKNLCQRLSLSETGIMNVFVSDYFRWIVNNHRLVHTRDLEESGRLLVLPVTEQLLSRAQSDALSHNAGSIEDLEQLRNIIEAITFEWSPAIPGNQDIMRSVVSAATAIDSAYTHRDFANNKQRMRSCVDNGTIIEIKGCALGKNPKYMEAVQSFFGSELGKPEISAPDLYQYYGRISKHVIPNDNITIKTYWHRWKVGKDTIPPVFKKWAKTFAPSLPFRKQPTWEDFAAYLRSGQALPFPNGEILLVLEGMSDVQVLNWLTKNDQRLTRAEYIMAQFPGRSISDTVTSDNIVEWLQSEYSANPKSRIFPYDPSWSNHFKTIAGVKRTAETDTT